MADFNVDELPDLTSELNVDDLPLLVKSKEPTKFVAPTGAIAPELIKTQPKPVTFPMQGNVAEQILGVKPTIPPVVPRETQTVPQEQEKQKGVYPGMGAEQPKEILGMPIPTTPTQKKPETKIEKEFAKSIDKWQKGTEMVGIYPKPEAPKPTFNQVIESLSTDQLLSLGNKGLKEQMQLVNPKSEEQLDFERQQEQQNNALAFDKEMGVYEARINALKKKSEPLKTSLEVKYGKGFEDKISINNYNKEMQGFESKYNDLKSKIDPLEASLKSKYGEGFQDKITQEAFDADPDLQEYIRLGREINNVYEQSNQLINKPEYAEYKNMLADKELDEYIKINNGIKDIYKESQQLINNPQFAEYKGMIEGNKVAQQKIDALKKEYQQKGFLGKAADIGLGLLEASSILKVIEKEPKTFTGTRIKDETDKFKARALTWLASVPKILENVNIVGQAGQYDFLDKWYDQAAEYATEKQLSKPLPSDVQRDIRQKYAVVNGYKVYLDDKNNPTDVRDSKGFYVDEKTQDSILKKYDANPKQYKTQEDLSLVTLGAKSVPTILDMSGLIALSAATGGSAATLVPGIAAQTYSDIYQDAVRKGLKPEDANDLATITGLAYGMIGLINPLESRIAQGTMGKAFNKLFGEGLTKADVALINSGKLSIKDFAKRNFVSAAKNIGVENAEEVVLEPLAQRAVEYAYNENAKQYGTGFDVNKPIIDSKEAIETAMITTMTSMLMSPMEVVSSMPEQRREALKRSLNMPEKYIQFKKEALDKGQITENEYNYDIATFNNVVAKYNAAKDLVGEDLQDELSELLLKKYTLEKKIEQVNDDALNVQNKKLLTDVNTRLQKMVEGTYDKEKEEVIRKEEKVKPEPVVSEGTGMIGKEASDVVNKLIAGQDLTSGERDIYDAYKPEIDKIVEAAKTKPKVEVVGEVKPTEKVIPVEEKIVPTQGYYFTYESESQIPQELKNIEPISKAETTINGKKNIKLTFSGKQIIDAGLEQKLFPPQTEVITPEVAPAVTKVTPTEVVAKEEVKTPIYEEEARKEEPVLEGVRDVGREAEAGQVSPELRPQGTRRPQEEKAVAPTEPVMAITSSETLNNEWGKLKEKHGNKKATKIYDNAIRLVDPNKNKIVEIRENGVVVKEGEKYTFKPFVDTDLKTWRLGSKSFDVTEQFIKTPTAEVKPSEEVTPSGIKPTEKPETAPEGVQKAKDVFTKAVELFYKGKDATSPKERRKLAEERRTLMEENPTMKYIDDNLKKIYKQLEDKGLLERKGDCP